MGEAASNVGFGRYLEGGTWKVGAWAGQGDVPVHKGDGAIGDYTDSDAVDAWYACRNAADTEANFYAKLQTEAPSTYTAISAWPSAIKTKVYEAANFAKVNNLDP